MRTKCFVPFRAVLICLENWFLTLQEEYTRRLGVFEKGVLGRIFGSKREEVAGGWRRLHNEELHNLYPSPNVIKAIKSEGMKWDEHIAPMGEMRNSYKIFVGKQSCR
jgi:hypothetical protein